MGLPDTDADSIPEARAPEPKEPAYKVNDRRGRDNVEPAEACRVCGCSVVHTREYNKPSMECIAYLRPLAQKSETLRLGEEPPRTFPGPLTAEEINTMDLEEACSQITNRVYEASLLFEQLEHRGVVRGNGHHAAQQVAEFAQNQMRDRWKTVPVSPGITVENT